MGHTLYNTIRLGRGRGLGRRASLALACGLAAAGLAWLALR